jgi:thymidine phosphorylase
MIKEVIAKWAAEKKASESEINQALWEVERGEATDAQIGAFFTGMKARNIDPVLKIKISAVSGKRLLERLKGMPNPTQALIDLMKEDE